MPSYGFPEFGVKGKKYGIVGGLGVVSDEVLSRISKSANIFGIGMRHLRGRELPVYEEIDGYRVVRPFHSLNPEEAVARSSEIFASAGIEFNGEHSREVPYLPFLRDYGLLIPEIRTQNDPELICSHDWMAIPGSYKKSLRCKAPFAAFLHSLESGRQNGIVHTNSGPKEACDNGYFAGCRTIRDIEVLGLKKADICFTVGLTMVKELKSVAKMHGIAPEKIEDKLYPLHHGVDVATYKPINTMGKEYDVIFIGRFSPVKGVMELMDAAKLLKKKYSDFKLKLIGGGELEGAIAERISKEELGGNIEVSTAWHQPEEKAYEINKAKIAVAPSKYEPHGQYDLEAGACGIPCINGTGGFMERMIDDVTALQCDPFDARDIAEKIDYLITNSEKAEEIGSNAREFVARYYDWDERAKIYPPLFEAVINHDHSRLKDIPLVVPIEETEFANGRVKALSW